MNIFFSYIRDFFKSIHSGLFFLCFIYAALIVFLNYRYAIEPKILFNISNRVYRFAGFYLMYLLAFSIPYLLVILVREKAISESKLFGLLILLAPAVFAFKVSFTGVSALLQYNIGGVWGRYSAIIAKLPSRLIVVVIPLLLVWWVGKYPAPFFGVTVRNFNWKPYAVMLLIMIPLISWASTQQDFLNTYPKLKQVDFINSYTKNSWWYRLLFEVSYGIDFVTIELFFRGFLVLAFIRFVGQDAILPMAVFYCSIHFGKPLAECISSFFGGLLLGIIVYRTGSITGGLMVHLGIAWMMEIGGYVGRSR